MARTLSKPVKGASPAARDLGELGQLVRNRRLEQALRIDDAAALLGVSTSVLSRLENGTPVGTDRLLRILEGLGLNLLVLAKADAAQALSILRSKSESSSKELP